MLKKMLIFLYATIIILFFSQCENTLSVRAENPAYLLGLWSNKSISESTNDTSYTILHLGEKGLYTYQDMFLPDSIIDYFEKGNWTIRYLDENNNNIFNTDEDNQLEIKVNESNIKSNIGKKSYIDFQYSIVDSSETLELFYDSSHNITLIKQ